MGLLNRVGRVARAGLEGAGRGVRQAYHSKHVGSGMALGGLSGGLLGGVADEVTPGEGGALGPAGLALGMVGGGGAGLAAKLAMMGIRGVAGGVRGASREVGRADRVAQQVLQHADARGRPPGLVEALVEEIGKSDPDLAREVTMRIMARAPY